MFIHRYRTDCVRPNLQQLSESVVSIEFSMTQQGFELKVSMEDLNKGSAKNNLVEFAPEFAVALIDLIEQNRRNSELFRGPLRLKIG
jgi:hypothetical protein